MNLDPSHTGEFEHLDLSYMMSAKGIKKCIQDAEIGINKKKLFFS